MNCRQRHSSLLLASLLGLASTHVFGACPAEEYAGQLRGRVEVKLETGQRKLLAVYQSNADLKIYLDAINPLWMNAPGEKNSSDLVYLDEGMHGAMPQLCLYTVYRGAAAGSFSIREFAVDSADSEARAVLPLLNVAAARWLDADNVAIRASADLYRQVAQSSVPSLRTDTTLDFYTRLFPALVAVKMRDFATADSTLNNIAGSALASYPEFYKVLLHLGRSQVRQNQYKRAIPLLEEALQALTKFESVAGESRRYERAELALFLSEAYTFDQQFDEAATVLAAAAGEVGSDYALQGRLHSSLAALAYVHSNASGLTRDDLRALYATAIDEVLMARHFSSLAEDMEILQVIENNAAVIYARAGETRKSMSHFLKVLEMTADIDNAEFGGFLFSNLGRYSMALGDYNRAAAYIGKSIEISNNMQVPVSAVNLCRLGTVHQLMGDLETALVEHQQCHEQALVENNRVNQIDALLQTSIDLLLDAENEAAESNARASIALLTDSIDPTRKLQVWTQLANVLFELQRYREAETAINTALGFAIDERFPHERITAQVLAMRIQRALGAVDVAIRLGAEAIEQIEQLYTVLDAERIGPAWSNQTSAAYINLADIHFTRYAEDGSRQELALALAASERSRDISLRQRLASGLSNDAMTLEEEKKLALFSRISNVLADPGAQPGSFNADLDYHYQHDLLSLSRLNNVDSIPVPPALDLTEIQARLRPQQLVLYYLVTDSALQVVAITSDSAQARAVAKTAELTDLLSTAASGLSTPRGFVQEPLATLAAQLLPDLRLYPAATEILVVPHTSLYTTPFAALPLPAAGGVYVPLVSRYALTIVPSLSAVWMDKPVRGVDYSADIAILADPVFDSLPLTLAQVLPQGNGLRGWSDSLQSLPYTAQEASNIASLVAGRSLLFTGHRATRANLGSAEVRNARVLHIATHGYFNSTSDDNVGLALSTVDEQGNRDPGFITLTELFGHAFNNELVVISGCDTAMGREQAGVGLNSLSRGFLAQGVKHVIATLWPVSDRASAEFMRLFYRQLQASRNVTLALQQAQQELARNPAYRNPYYWAGYTLTSVSPDPVIGLQQ
ncbi:MAG: CHAT domain-containing tetratricopeptide repeat protein [Pseudomonadota bacterium]